MYGVSAAFQSAMAAGGTRLVKIEQLDSAMAVKATFDTKVFAGRVDVAQSKEIRRTLAMSVANPDGTLTPSLTSDPFFFNQRFRVWLGTVKADGTSEYAPIGTFLVNVADADQQTQTLAVVAVDFWKYLQLAALKTLKSYAVASTLTSIFNDLLDTAQTFLGGITIPRTIDPIAGAATLGGTDPLQFAAGARVADCLSPFMESYGWDFGFDLLGTFNGRLYVKPETVAPSFTLSDTDQGVSRLNPRMEDSPDVRNHVRVVGTSPDVVPFSAEAQDNNMNSPTYVGGIFGDRLDVLESPDILDANQAQNVANARLRRLIALATTVAYEGTPRPELDIWDVGTLTSVRGKFSAMPYWVESMSIPLTTEPMTMRLAAVRPLA